MTIKGFCLTLKSITLSLAIAASASPAFCSDGGHGADHGSIADLGIYWVNFLIYVGLLYFLLRKSVNSGWAARRDKIESDVTGGKIEIDAAEAKIAGMRGRMDLIGEDIERIRDTTEKETERESREVVETARVLAQRISQRMHESCSAEQRSAETGIRRELADMALKMAREQLCREINAESDRPYREAVANSAGRLLQ